MDDFTTVISEDVRRSWDLLQQAKAETEHSKTVDIRGMINERFQEHLPKDIIAFLHRDYEYHARQFFRAGFAFIEGITFAMKALATERCLSQGITISQGELDFVEERDYKIADGKVTEQRAHIRLQDNVRLAIALIERAAAKQGTFKANVKWWSQLMESIRVRDRLMHPKKLADVAISEDEVQKLYEAYIGLLDFFRGIVG